MSTCMYMMGTWYRALPVAGRVLQVVLGRDPCVIERSAVDGLGLR